jgi:hypothetical protein
MEKNKFISLQLKEILNDVIKIVIVMVEKLV